MLKLDEKALAEIKQRMSELEERLVKREVGKAMRKAMRPVRDEVDRKVPVDTGDVKAHVVMRTSRRKGNIYVRIGVQGGAKKAEGVPYYWRMVELGTKNQPAQPFMRPALEDNADEVARRAIEELRKAIFK